MPARKFKNLFKENKTSGEKSQNKKLTTSNKEKSDMEPAIDRSKNSKEKNTQEKTEIEMFKKAIEKKLKDPAMAKKAAQIISDLLKK